MCFRVADRLFDYNVPRTFLDVLAEVDDQVSIDCLAGGIIGRAETVGGGGTRVDNYDYKIVQFASISGGRVIVVLLKLDLEVRRVLNSGTVDGVIQIHRNRTRRGKILLQGVPRRAIGAHRSTVAVRMAGKRQW